MEFMDLDEGLGKAKKARKIVEGNPEIEFPPIESTTFQSCVLKLCGEPGDNNKVLLHEKFKRNLEETINSTVLPSLAAKENEALLREFVLMWSNYNLMASSLCSLFEYPDCCSSSLCSVVSLGEIAIDCFHSLVFNVLRNRIQEAAMTLINEERHGKQIDPKLLQDVMSIFKEIGKNKSIPYYENFLQAMHNDSAAFYSPLSSQWVADDNLPDYIQKERAGHYLDPSFVFKLIQKQSSRPPVYIAAAPSSVSCHPVPPDFPLRSPIADVPHLHKHWLQHYAQKRNLSLPVYSCEREGPAHAIRFKCSVTIDGRTYQGQEFLRTLKDAEQAAAKVALISLMPNGVLENDSGYKNLLGEILLKEGQHGPLYSTTMSGEPHMPDFVSTVEIGGERFTGQVAKKKKLAEGSAAKVAYNMLRDRKSSQIPLLLTPGLQGQEGSNFISSNILPAVATDLQQQERPKAPKISVPNSVTGEQQSEINVAAV